jgi:hypothetical protein
MKARNVLTIVLLLFVAVSVFYLIRGQDDSSTVAEETVSANDRVVVAYYFHRTARCRTCRAIEANAHDVLTTAFPTELESGVLEWRAVNLDEPGNEHFAKEYEILASTLVLVQMVGGEPGEWANLEGVWPLVDDEEEFDSYVKEHTESFLKEL